MAEDGIPEVDVTGSVVFMGKTHTVLDQTKFPPENQHDFEARYAIVDSAGYGVGSTDSLVIAKAMVFGLDDGKSVEELEEELHEFLEKLRGADLPKKEVKDEV